MNGKRLAMCVGAAAFTAVAFGGSATNKWTDATVHDSIFNAADWNSVSSWNPAEVPNGPTTDAWLPNRTHYVTNSQPLSLYSFRNIEGPSGNRFVYVSDEPVSFYTVKTATWRVGGGRFYAPVHFAGGGETYLGVVEFCGDVVCDDAASGPFGHSQKVEWRFDKFANAAGADRVAYPLDAALRSYDSFFSFYCPQGSATNVTYAYKLTAGSPYVKKVATVASPVIPAGTIVTGAGVPEGTFVKRIFPDWSLELSAPATASADTTPLTFAAFTPNVHQYMRSFAHNNAACCVGLKVMKYRAEDEIELQIDSLGLCRYGSGYFSFRTESGFQPGLVTLHATSDSYANGYPVELATCHLNFSTASSKYGPGLPTAVVWQGSDIPKGTVGYKPAASVSRLTVANGLSARIGWFTNLVGCVVKDGAGSLEIGLTNLVAANTGRLVAEAGRLAISSDAALEPSYVGTLAVSNGATFKLPVQGLRTSDFAFETGAVIEGPGTLYVPEAHDGYQGLVFTGGAKVSFDKSTTVVRTQPETETVPGNPAFWVDCSNLDTLTYTTVNGTNFVTRINDVRKTSEDDGYLFSTNASGPDSLWKPILRQEAQSKMHYVSFKGNYTNYVYTAGCPAGDPALSDTHVWSSPVTNIHVVFQAFEPAPSGNCPFLGATKSCSHFSDELNRYSSSYSGKIFDWAKTDLAYWDLTINGEPVNNADGYPYQTIIPYPTYAPYYRFVPFTMSLRVRPDAPAEAHPGANSYDYCAGYSNQNKTGGKLLGELLVYTNDLTDVECQRITAYLMKKWNFVSYQYTPEQDDGNTLGAVGANLASAVSVQTEKEVMADAFIGEGTFAKNGDGGLFVKGVASGASLAVNGGTLEIRSRTLDAALVPSDAYRWYDAEKLSAFAYEVGDGGVTNISSWADARGTAGYEATLKSSASTNRPTLRSFAALGGKTAVDFGEVIRFPNNASVDWTAAPSLVYTNSDVTLRTVIAVWGSEHGGGSLVGSPNTSHYLASEYTLVRAGLNAERIGSDKNAAIIRGTDMLFPTIARYPRGKRFRLNGVRCDPNSTGLSGSFDLVSYVGYEPFGSAGLSGVNNGPQWVGGEQFAEYLLFQRGLSEQEVDDVEAYLNKKWFGRSTPGYGPVVLGDVTVAAGATLKITGNAPVTVSSLAGSGTIDGEVVLAEDASFTIEVAEDGSCSKLSVGSIDLSKPLTVNFTGYVRKFALGEHVVLESPSITAGMPLNWTVTGLARSRFCSLRAENGAVVGTVTSGLTISFR